MSALSEIDERDAEFYRAYKRALENKGTTHNEALQAAINTQSSRYWVSSDYIYRYILARIRGYATAYDPQRRAKRMRKCKEKMYDELWEVYKVMRKKPMFRGCSTYFICSFVVNRPAPKFYISLSHARRLITKIRKLNKNKLKLRRL